MGLDPTEIPSPGQGVTSSPRPHEAKAWAGSGLCLVGGGGGQGGFLVRRAVDGAGSYSVAQRLPTELTGMWSGTYDRWAPHGPHTGLHKLQPFPGNRQLEIFVLRHQGRR